MTLFFFGSALFAFLFFIYTTLILARNSVQLKPIIPDDVHNKNPDPIADSITICIPARNEEEVIEQVTLSALNQQDEETKVVVLDDNSTDQTGEILSRLNAEYQQLTVISGRPKPDDWLGKPWASQQLFEQAKTEWLIFVDADTQLEPGFIEGVRTHISYYNLEGFTVWPRQILKSTAEKIIVPMVYYALLTMLNSIYVFRPPRWMPSFLKQKFHPAFAAACGQCMGFKRSALTDVGGFSGVKEKVVDDVELSRLMLLKRHPFRMFHGVEGISCRMYRDYSTVFEGFRKNFFAGFQYNYGLFILMAVIHLIAFIIPAVILGYGFATLHSGWIFIGGCLVLLPIVQRMWLASWFKWENKYAFTHILGVIWFQYLGIITMKDRLLKRKVNWKGRDV